MDKLIELSHTEIVLAFAAFCIESTARRLGKSYQEVYKRMKAELSKRLKISPSEALQLFYASKTCADLHDKETGLYLYGDRYIADEFIRECQDKI